MAEAKRGRNRQIDGGQGALSYRPDRRCAGRRLRSAAPAIRNREVRLSVDHRRRNLVRLRSAHRTKTFRQARQARRDRGCIRAERRPQSAVAGDPGHPPCRNRGSDRAGAGTGGQQGNEFLHLLPPEIPAWFRRRRSLRRQLLRSIVIEALAIGILAAVIGLFAGLALAKGLFALFDTVGFTLPNNGLTFETRTVVVSLAVGIIVTLLASLRPALRATRVPPIAAVREGATLPESRYARFRLPASALLTALGFGGLLWGLFAPGLGTAGILLFMLGGALLVFIGIALLSVRLVTPLAGTLGWPATKVGGTAGTLARENAQRNPQRTASTASALMIGLALVTLVTMLAAGIISSFKGSVNEIWKNADYAITAQNNFSPIPIAAADAVAKTPDVLAVGNVRAGEALAFGKRINTTAVNPAASQMFNLDWKQESGAILGNLGEDGAFVDKGYAKSHHLELGSPVPLTFPDASRELFYIKGIFAPPTGGSPFGAVTISVASCDRHVDAPQNLYSFVLMKGGQSPANAAALDRTLKKFPNAKVATRQKFIDNQISGLSSVLNILYVLLALSVVVSLFGIVNTLVLTVFEWTREIGM